LIHGIGSDIVSLGRVARIYSKFPGRFAERILNRSELEAFARAHDRVAFLGKRFAVKEAAAKALGTGFSGGVAMCDIVLEHDALGKPILSFTGCTAQRCREMRIGESHVSVSDERDYALAFVIMICRDGTGG